MVSKSETENETHVSTDEKLLNTQDSPSSTAVELPPTTGMESLLPWTGALVWPCFVALPLVLTWPNSGSPTHYTNVFPKEWYEMSEESPDPKPLGLCLGMLAVVVGHMFLLPFFYMFKFGYLNQTGTSPQSIQAKGARPYDFMEGLSTHLAQPGGFFLMGSYLSITWMMNWMPSSYYSFEGGIQWKETLLCLIIQDGYQYVMHRLEHVVSPTFYKFSHKPHHVFTNPRLFDAYNGSIPDTACMILIPLFATAHTMRTCNVWTYMAFGSLYANWLTLIHSEYVFPWDGIFRKLGMGTPGDHHVHHKFFKYNYGHLFMWFDQIAGTYRDPKTFAPKAFNLEA